MSAEVSASTTYGNSAQETHHVTAEMSDYSLAPGTTIVVYSAVKQGQTSVPYSALLNLTYVSGFIGQALRDTGLFSGIVGTEVDVVFGDADTVLSEDRELRGGSFRRSVAKDPHGLTEETVIV